MPTLVATHAISMLLLVGGLIVGIQATYLAIVALAAFRYRPPAAGRSSRLRLGVLVPAHNESELIERCVSSLLAQSYPRDQFRVVVVADNCTDDTAHVAAAAGAHVMVRHDPKAFGKGHALRWGMTRLLAEDPDVDAIVVVDADSVADRTLLLELSAAAERGADVVQATYLALPDPGASSQLRQAAFLLFHYTRFAGRDVLGMPANLVGNGMLFRRALLERHPWDAFSSTEDLEFSMNLRLAGVRPRFGGRALVRGPAAGYGRAAAMQRMRWEGGRFHVVRTRLLRLVRSAAWRRDPTLLDAALDLAVPPLGLLAMIASTGLAGAVIAHDVAGAPGVAVALWSLALTAMAVYVLAGLRAAGAPGEMYRALAATPRLLLAKLGTYARMTRGLNAERWERTERPGEQRRRQAARIAVAGVPIDLVDQRGAVEAMMDAVDGDSLFHVCTVNLQFVATARRNRAVRSILESSSLNVADGMPVVHLARLLGGRVPGRVTGADIVPHLAAEAERRGVGMFLLGGCDGSASAAAEVLRHQHPSLSVAVHEPPMAPITAMDTDTIVERIRRSGARILLVAFGHPKQELWIASVRERLPVAVAMGIGCTLDLIAGRRRRSPRWMRRSGLEWLYRLAHEPRRLAWRYASELALLATVLLPVTLWHRVTGRVAVFVTPTAYATEPARGPAPDRELTGHAAVLPSLPPS